MILTLTVLLALFLLALLYQHRRTQAKYKQIEKIPGPPAWPLVGNALEIGTNTTDVLKNLTRLTKRYGHLVKLRIGSSPHILATEPKFIRQILLDENTLKSDFAYDLLKDITGNGLITISGDQWNKHRKIISPTFSSKNLEKFLPDFNRNANNLVQQVKRLAANNSGNIDVTHHIFSCALNTVCNAVMQVDVPENGSFFKAVGNFMDLLMSRYFSAFKRYDFLYRLTEDHRQFQSYKKTLRNFTEYVMDRHKREPLDENASTKPKTSLLNQLIQLGREGVLSYEEIRDEAQTFIIAGSDTVASTLSFGLYELTKHPTIQAKILEELDCVFGKNADLLDITFEEASGLKYTERVFKEILRFYAPVQLMARNYAKDITFDDMVIPAGVNLLIFVMGTHMSERNHANAKSFDPDRFLPENSGDLHPYAFIPFGGGPRVCVGFKYAMLEAKVVLAKLIRNFELLPAKPEHELVLALSGTLKSANGLPLRLRARST